MSSNTGAVTILDSIQSHLETGSIPLLLERLEDDEVLNSFLLDLGGGILETAMRAESMDLWHQRLGHVNRRSLYVPKKMDYNGVNCGRDVSACNICVIGERIQ